MLTVVCFLWRRAEAPCRYGPEHVNTLQASLRRHLPWRHRMVCVTDDAAGLNAGIVPFRVTPELVAASPKRFLKLVAFRRDAASLFGGDRLLCIDLDVTPVADLGPLVDRPEDFVIWRDALADRPGGRWRYNSSLILMDAGCRAAVWETFDARTAPGLLREARLSGSDQAWIGHVLGPGEAVWTRADGVLSHKFDLDGGSAWSASARLIVSHGTPKPWELPAGHPLRIAYEARA